MGRLILLLFLCSALPTLAQNLIEVKVTDTKAEALPFINITIRNRADSSVVAGGITDEQGIFRIGRERAEPLKEHILTISGIGFSTETIRDLSPLKFEITLQEAEQMLDGVTVRATPKTMTRFAPDGGVEVSLVGSPLSHIGTGMDLLAQLPLLSGNSERVTVLGKGEPLIYINGRKANGVLEVKQLKSSDIKSVKVITNPGALYDASVSSVVLISTYKPSGDRLGAWLRAKMSIGDRLSHSQYISLQYRRGKLDIFGSVYNIHSDDPSKVFYTIKFPTGIDKDVADSGQMRIKRWTQHYTLGANYQLSERHSIGLKHIFTRSPKGNTLTSNSVSTQSMGVKTRERYEGDKDMTSRSHNLNLYWLGQITDHYLVKLDADLYDTRSNRSENILQFTNSGLIGNTHQMKSRLYAARLVNVFNLWNGELNLGGELSSTENNQTSGSSSALIGGGTDRLLNTTMAGFVTYNRTFGRFSPQVGLRAELNEFTYYRDGMLQEEQSKRYQHLFPHFSLLYRGWADVLLSYKSSIKRPSYHQLRSGVQYNNANIYESGNPYLQPTISQTVSLGVQRGNLMLEASYSLVRDFIHSNLSLYKGQPIVLYQHKNLDSSKMLHLHMSYQKEIGFWSPDLYIGYDKPFIKIGDQAYNRGVLTLELKNTFSLPYGISVWGNYSFQSRGHQDIAQVEPIHTVSLLIMKKLLQNKLSVALEVSDLFDKERTEYVMNINGISAYNHTKADSRRVSLTISYNFNRKKSRYKGSQSTSEIDRL